MVTADYKPAALVHSRYLEQSGCILNDPGIVYDRVRELGSINGPKNAILYPTDLALPRIRDRDG